MKNLITPIKNPRDITKQLLSGNRAIGYFQAFEPHEWFASGMSSAVSGGQAEARGNLDCFNPNSPSIDPNTVFNVASITKPVTAATILRMQESEKFQQYFSQGIKTRISEFLPVLKARYPNSEYIQNGLEQENNFAEMNLSHLLNHTSGLGDFDGPEFNRKFRFESPESLAQEPDGKFLTMGRRTPRPEFGQHSYSNCGYELLGMIISAIGSDEAKEKVLCGEVIREMVIDRLELPHTFTPDQMRIGENGIYVEGRPDQLVAQGFDCGSNGDLHYSKVFRRCIATSGIYSNPRDLCKFAKEFFSGRLFENPETFALLDDPRFQVPTNDKGDYYGIGHEAYHVNGVATKFHGGRTAGYFNWLGWREKEGEACCLTGCENLTPFFARAMFESGNEDFKTMPPQERDQLLRQINSDLLAQYSVNELCGALRAADLPSLKTPQEGNTALLRELKNLDKTPAALVSGHRLEEDWKENQNSSEEKRDKNDFVR